MYYCNEFLSKSVLSLYEGELIGKVDKLYFDKKLKRLIEIELISEDDTRYLLPTKNIYHIGKNAITVKNNQTVKIKVDESNLQPSPIGSKAYSIKGEYLGIIRDISLDEKYFIQKYSLDESTLSVSELATCGKNTIIFYDNSEKININKFNYKPSPKNFKTKVLQIVETQPIANAEPITEHKKIQSTEFLLGRICTKDIYNFNNELLIKSNAIVNKKNLKDITKFGKIRELMLYIK